MARGRDGCQEILIKQEGHGSQTVLEGKSFQSVDQEFESRWRGNGRDGRCVVGIRPETVRQLFQTQIARDA
jgi:hypothetical protein